MATTSSDHRKKIFVSYSRKDWKWREQLHTHLAGLERQFPIIYWDDTQIRPGADWRQELREALATTTHAVLLVSPDFLASEFIQTEELPTLLEAARKRGVRILPVILKTCLFTDMESISRFESINPPDRPLTRLRDRDAVFVRVAREIVATPSTDEGQERAKSTATPEARKPFHVFLATAHEALLENERLRLVHELLRLGMVPTGRQYLPPQVESDWPAIQRMIDGSDYFLTVVPSRASAPLPNGTTPESIKLEYQHACKAGKPILALLPAGKSRVGATGPFANYRRLVESGGVVRFWSDRESLCRELAQGLSALSTGTSDRSRAVAAETESSRLALAPGSYYRQPIPRLMTEYLKSSGIDVASVHPLRTSLEFTIRDLEKLVSIRYQLDRQDAIELLDKARGWAYDRKYGNRSSGEDERNRVGIDRWRAELRTIFRNLSLKLHDLPYSTALNVGIGNGSEGEPGAELYGRFKRGFVGVDIAPGALEQAKALYSRMEGREGPAEKLPVKSGTVNVYFSFRTFQSTFFDIDRALYEACRVLLPRGSLIISIPNKFLEGDILKEGLFRPESAELGADVPYLLDPELPYAYASKIRRSLYRLNFEKIGIMTGAVEIYVYGRRKS